MKKYLYLIFIFISCQQIEVNDSSSDIELENSLFIEEKPDYETFKNSVLKDKSNLKNKSHQDRANYFFYLLFDDIFYYWQKTEWDFSGTTQKPKEGYIACGYFVTNTLTDLGFKIDRIKLAQAASSEMINELCVEIKTFNSLEKLEKHLDKQPNNSAYIIGLDYHTGYILKEKDQSYFMHSNYMNSVGVVKEKLQESKALTNNNIYMIGSLTANQKLLSD